MLTKEKMQEIQELKLRGFSKNEIIKQYESRGEKPPSIPTLNKYYAMDAVPEDPGAKLEKAKAFDHEPFRKTIIAILEMNAKKSVRISSVYDVLLEMFVENGECESLPGNEQTLRNYVHYLEGKGMINREPEHRRIYDYVFDTPPGQQMLIDFGELRIHQGLTVHFICMLLRYSRMICVYAQDHKYNAEDACRAIYHGFCKLGGRPEELVIDQDSVFVSAEYLGEITESHVFKQFIKEQGLRLWVCNKNDPESKGPIENVVGFVKKNFFSARNIQCVDDVWRSLPGWVERKNKRIHKATFRVPEEVFAGIERAALRPLLPSVYDEAMSGFIPARVGGLQ
jgi:hypothetical protein